MVTFKCYFIAIVEELEKSNDLRFKWCVKESTNRKANSTYKNTTYKRVNNILHNFLQSKKKKKYIISSQKKIILRNFRVRS